MFDTAGGNVVHSGGKWSRPVLGHDDAPDTEEGRCAEHRPNVMRILELIQRQPDSSRSVLSILESVQFVKRHPRFLANDGTGGSNSPAFRRIAGSSSRFFGQRLPDGDPMGTACFDHLVPGFVSPRCTRMDLQDVGRPGVQRGENAVRIREFQCGHEKGVAFKASCDGQQHSGRTRLNLWKDPRDFRDLLPGHGRQLGRVTVPEQADDPLNRRIDTEKLIELRVTRDRTGGPFDADSG